MNERRWTIKGLLQVASDYLKAKDIDSPRLTAEILLSHQLKLDRINLYLNFDKPLTQDEISGFRSLVKRRIKREPVQYITGVQEFWSLKFKVNRHVLIPRSDSEILVEKTVEKIAVFHKQTGLVPRILDLATGSGALAVSICREIPDAMLWATDISAKALDVARYNARVHGVSDRIRFIEGNLWKAVSDMRGFFDIIVTNPPYIAEEEYQSLQPEVLYWEPVIALNGGKGGMFFIKKIIRHAHHYIKSGGWLMIEMDPSQTLYAISLMKENPSYKNIFRIKDYTQQYRMVVCQRS